MKKDGKKLRLGGTEATRVPPGQFLTAKLPVMTAMLAPRIPLERWRLQITGLVLRPMELDWDRFMGMPQVTMNGDFHCVTQWSRLDNTWEGVRVRDLLEPAVPSPEAAFVMVHCHDGYTTNMDLATLLGADALLAHHHDGLPLTLDHGAPMRLVLPQRYGWKSAKWVQGLELMNDDNPGFWELRGYHMRGDPWQEERFQN